jgi:predicted ATP pyrophosphatase (TIGR00289 family)
MLYSAIEDKKCRWCSLQGDWNFMKVAVLFSGGKDSCFAYFWAKWQGYEPFLLTMEPEPYSMMFHHPNIRATRLQAKALGANQVFVKVGEEDWEEKMLAALKKTKAEAIVTGAVESEYQRWRIEKVANVLTIPHFSPLWHKTDVVLKEMLEYFEIYVTAVAADGLGPEFLGEPLKKLVQAKAPGVHPMLEGGEAETFVVNAPFFKKPVKIKGWKKSWDGVRGVAEIE